VKEFKLCYRITEKEQCRAMPGLRDVRKTQVFRAMSQKLWEEFGDRRITVSYQWSPIQADEFALNEPVWEGECLTAIAEEGDRVK